MSHVNITENSQNVKALWTKIYLYMKFNYPTLSLSAPYHANKNLNQIFEIFKSISSISNDVTTKFNINNESDFSIMNEILYHYIFNDLLIEQMNPHLEHFVNLVFSFYISNDEFNDYANIITQFTEVIQNSPLDLEKLFLDIFKTELSKFLVKMTSGKDDLDVSLLSEILEMKRDTIDRHIIPTLFPKRSKTDDNDVYLPEKFFYDNYFNSRLKVLFDIFMAYPESSPTLLDLSHCITFLHCEGKFCEVLMQQIRERLIHPAVATPDLISAYICIIRSMRIIDRTRVFEESVTPDIQNYLLKREDTIKVIVDRILSLDSNKNGSSIYEDLEDGDVIKIVDQNGISDCGDVKCAYEDIHDWTPEPIDIRESKILWRKKLDVLSLLLSIYSSKELFAKEYKQLLSQKILRNMNFDEDSEIRNLDILKKKFGAQNFRDCDVMLKDIKDSKKFNKLVHEKGHGQESPVNVNAYIISRQYWSKVSEKTFKMPPMLQESFDRYAKVYTEYKRNRQLTWHPMMGSVSVEIEIGHRKIQIEVRPLQAAVIDLFTSKNRWELGKLAKELELSVSETRRAVNFWVRKDVVKRLEDGSIPETYCVLDDGQGGEAGATSNGSAPDNSLGLYNNQYKKRLDLEVDNDEDDLACGESVEDEEGHCEMTEAGDEDAQQNERLWQMVKLILKNTCSRGNSVDVDQLLYLISIYSVVDPIKVTRDQLQLFLDRKVAKNVISVAQKKYSI